MSWIKTFLRVITGEVFKEEAEKHQQAMNDARDAVRRAKETLGGEAHWLWRQDDQKTCNLD